MSLVSRSFNAWWGLQQWRVTCVQYPYFGRCRIIVPLLKRFECCMVSWCWMANRSIVDICFFSVYFRWQPSICIATNQYVNLSWKTLTRLLSMLKMCHWCISPQLVVDSLPLSNVTGFATAIPLLHWKVKIPWVLLWLVLRFNRWMWSMVASKAWAVRQCLSTLDRWVRDQSF